MNEKKISCVIPSYSKAGNKASSLSLLLGWLDKLPISTLGEIILVAIDKQVHEIAATFEGLPIKIIDYPHPYDRSGARNVGVDNASEEIIWFLDDDTLPMSAQSINSVVYELPNGAFACGAKRYWTPIGYTSEWITHLLKDGCGTTLVNSCFLPAGINRETGYRDLQEFSFFGNCGFIHKEDFTRIGGFDEVKFKSRREDVEIMYRMCLNGFNYMHLYDICEVVHLNHSAFLKEPDERLRCHETFRKLEEEKGYRFRVNNLFGINELDGFQVLEKIGSTTNDHFRLLLPQDGDANYTKRRSYSERRNRVGSST